MKLWLYCSDSLFSCVLILASAGSSFLQKPSKDFFVFSQSSSTVQLFYTVSANTHRVTNSRAKINVDVILAFAKVSNGKTIYIISCYITWGCNMSTTSNINAQVKCKASSPHHQSFSFFWDIYCPMADFVFLDKKICLLPLSYQFRSQFGVLFRFECFSRPLDFESHTRNTVLFSLLFTMLCNSNVQQKCEHWESFVLTQCLPAIKPVCLYFPLW